jgi:hypothetical protein
MKGTITTGIPVPAVKRIRRGLMWFSLFVLLGLVGAGIIHVSLAGASTSRQLAPAPGTGGGTDSGPTSVRIGVPAEHHIAATTSNIHVGNGG